MKKTVLGNSMLVNINIPNQPTFTGFIDENGEQWIVLKSFIDSIGMPDKIYRKYQLPKLKYLTFGGVIPKLYLRSIANYKSNSKVYLLDKDFFFNTYLMDKTFWKINNRILPAFAEVKNTVKHEKGIDGLFSQTNSSVSFVEDIINNQIKKVFSCDNSNTFNDINDTAESNHVNIDTEKLNELINTAVQNSIENSLPKIINSISDLFLRLAPGPGTKHYYADKLTTTQPDSDKYFSIRDFLIEKRVSLVFLKLFGGVVATHYGKVAIKYIPPNGNEKSSQNYYPITYKPLVEALFTKFSQSFESNKEAVL